MMIFSTGLGIKVAVDASPDAPATDRNEVCAVKLVNAVRFVGQLTDQEQKELRDALAMVEVKS